jgi:predicted nucleotidyltransferase
MFKKIENGNEEYMNYLNLIVESLKRILKENLVSVVLFGSVARGEAGEGSDIDLLVVTKNFGTSGSRFEIVNKIDDELRKTEEYYELKEKKLGTLISPVPLTPDEINLGRS